MNHQENYILAMKKLKFRENLKSEILKEVGSKLEKQWMNFLPKTVISLACIQALFCFFSVSSVSYFMI